LDSSERNIDVVRFAIAFRSYYNDNKVIL